MRLAAFRLALASSCLAAATGVLAAPARTFTVAEGNVRVTGDEEVCFRLTDDRMASDRVVVRLRFRDAVPRGWVELDGARSDRLAGMSQEIPFLVDPRGVHRLALAFESSATLELLTVSSTESMVEQVSCTAYDFEAERRVELDVPPAPSTSRFETPEDRAARERSEADRRVDDRPATTAPSAATPAPLGEGMLPAGTELNVTLQTALDTRTSYVGQAFSSVLDQDATVGGKLILPAGTRIEGHVAESKDAGRYGRSSLRLAFERAVLPDGRSVAMSAAVERLGPGSAKKQAGIIAGSAAGGALLGAILGDSDKAALGALLGGAIAAGAIGAKPGESVVVPAGSVMGIRTDAAVYVAPPEPRQRP